MKEVKFRGKDIIDHNWYYGYYMNRYMFGQVIYAITRCGLPVAHIVEAKTVGIWIGELDKNGVEIYDNDIICVDYSTLKGLKNFEPSKEFRHRFKFGVVEVDLPNIRVREISDSEYGFYDDLGETFSWHDVEVIGNVFEPPIETLMLDFNRDKT